MLYNCCAATSYGMEGQSSKIRTMARDLKAAGERSIKDKETKAPQAPTQKPRVEPPEIRPIEAKLTSPTKPTLPRPDLIKDEEDHKEEIRKNDGDARPIIQEIKEVKPQPEQEEGGKVEKTLAEILSGAREKMEETPKNAEDQEKRTGAEPQTNKTGEDLLPIEDTAVDTKPSAPSQPTASHGQPPQNLPTGEPTLIETKEAPTLPTRSLDVEVPASSAGGPTPRDAGEKLAIDETPEKILGIPDRELKDKKREPPKKPVVTPTKKISSLPKKPRKLSTVKFVLITTVLGFILMGIVSGLYFSVFKGPSEGRDTVLVVAPVVSPEPKSLIKYDSTYAIEVDELSYEALMTKIESLSSLVFPEKTITYIPIKYMTPKLISYLTFDELTNILDIPVPSELLDKDFNLFLYNQSDESAETCESAGILRADCSGPRLGLIIGVGNEETAIADIMLKWEKTITADLGPLILAKYHTKDGSFSNGSYEGVSVRYKNLPQEEGGQDTNTTSVDWAIINERLVIGTSMNTVRSALNKLLTEN